MKYYECLGHSGICTLLKWEKVPAYLKPKQPSVIIGQPLGCYLPDLKRRVLPNASLPLLGLFPELSY